MLKIAPMCTKAGLEDDKFAAATKGVTDDTPKHDTTQQTTQNKFILTNNEFASNFLTTHSLHPIPTVTLYKPIKGKNFKI